MLSSVYWNNQLPLRINKTDFFEILSDEPGTMKRKKALEATKF